MSRPHFVKCWSNLGQLVKSWSNLSRLRFDQLLSPWPTCILVMHCECMSFKSKNQWVIITCKWLSQLWQKQKSYMATITCHGRWTESGFCVWHGHLPFTCVFFPNLGMTNFNGKCPTSFYMKNALFRPLKILGMSTVWDLMTFRVMTVKDFPYIPYKRALALIISL